MKIKYALVLGLAACNSSETVTNFSSTQVRPTTITAQGDVTTVTNDPSYETLGSRSGKTITLSGSAVKMLDNGQLSSQFFEATGEAVAAENGAFQLTDFATVTDSDGFEQEGTALEPKLVARQTQDDAVIELLNTGSNYDYAQVYGHTRTVGGQTQLGMGIAGIETRTVDMPTVGSAKFTGDSVAFYADGTRLLNSEGYSTIEADFAAGEVDVRSRFIIWRDENSSISSIEPFDELQHNNMKITGATFQGGNHTVLDGGTVVTVTGANTVAGAQGNFYGGKITTKNGVSTKRPAEVAGVAAISGDDSRIWNLFIGD